MLMWRAPYSSYVVRGVGVVGVGVFDVLARPTSLYNSPQPAVCYAGVPCAHVIRAITKLQRENVVTLDVMDYVDPVLTKTAHASVYAAMRSAANPADAMQPADQLLPPVWLDEAAKQAAEARLADKADRTFTP